MTNHWNDIDNASLVFVMGANPAENHPACMAHINAARARGAKLVVVDPRKTRTACQADTFIRVRPGTDIAFVNGMLNYIFGQIAAGAAGYNSGALANMVAWHNGTAANSTAARSFKNDDGTAGNVTISKYTDSLFRVAANGDYLRASQASSTGTISNFPVRAASVEATADTVWMTLKAHVAEYSLATTADICGCQESDIVTAAKYFIDHSRFASTDWNAATATPQNGPSHETAPYRATTWLYAMGGTQHTYGSQNIRQYAVIQSLMGNMGRAGGGINALRGIHNVQGSTDMGLLYDTYPAYGTMAKDTQTWAEYHNLQFGHRTVGTGAKDTTYYGTLGLQQQGFFNMTRQFFAGAAKKATPVAVVDETYTVPTPAAAFFLKQQGVTNVVVKSSDLATTYTLDADYRFDPLSGTVKPMGSRIVAGTVLKISYSYDQLSGAEVAALWDYWPKNNGYDHITSFRKMRSSVADADRVKACFILGQNPLISEPNQSAVRDGLHDLDLLVVAELFPTETVQCSRKSGSVTYLLPSCAYPEEAGSVTNSGRWLQWREQAKAPKGNSKTDLELILRLAKALDDHGGFSHLPAVASGFSSRFEQLYGYYTPDWTPTTGTFDCEAFAQNVYMEIAAPLTETYTVFPGETGYNAALKTIDPSNPLLRGATMWIYFKGYSNHVAEALPGGYPNFTVNRAKSRDKTAGTANTYSRWGYAWLNNRRVFYNNGEVPGDQADNFVSPDYLARLYINRNVSVVDYAAGGGAAYRNYKVMKDVSSIDATHPNGKNGTRTYGQLPAHSEMIESNRPDLATTWGTNEYIDTASYNANIWDQAASPTPAVFHECYPTDGATAIGEFGTGAGQFPLLLTTIRCVEHFQGGPITRNNSWNVEAEPVPWIEINSIDAAKYGISDGDWVNITTARSDSKGDQEGRTRAAAGWARGFKARVGSGLQSNQRVAPGVVAIPWHWGEQGLATGSRANDLCIDAFDANTKIPEYKACLCKVQKIPTVL